MRLKYDVSEDDFWAFQEHFNRNSSEMRQIYRRIALYGAPLVGVLAFLVFQRMFAHHGYVFNLCIALALAGVWMALMLTTHKRNSGNRRYLGKPYQKLIEGALGEEELELTPKGLRSINHTGEMVWFWDSIVQVATTPTHTFIYIGKAQGLIIPQNRILGGNYPAFMQAFADVYATRQAAALESIAITQAAVTQTEPTEQTQQLRS